MDGATDFWTDLETFALSIENETNQSRRHLHDILDSFRSMPPAHQEAARAHLDAVLAELGALRPLIRVLVAAGEG